jgi:hypothetical protein
MQSLPDVMQTMDEQLERSFQTVSSRLASVLSAADPRAADPLLDELCARWTLAEEKRNRLRSIAHSSNRDGTTWQRLRREVEEALGAVQAALDPAVARPKASAGDACAG